MLKYIVDLLRKTGGMKYQEKKEKYRDASPHVECCAFSNLSSRTLIRKQKKRKPHVYVRILTGLAVIAPEYT
jgi:hypothetical protein